MTFMAAALAACMHQENDPTWTPPIGTLIVRARCVPGRLDLVYQFHGDAADPDHYTEVARVDGWAGQPYFGSDVECSDGSLCMTGSGAPIVRWSAYPRDVRLLLALWDDNDGAWPVGGWLREIAGRRGLSEASRAMVAEVAAEMGIDTESAR